MSPVLYFVPYSQPSRAVLLTIKALNIQIELKELNLFKKEQYSPEYVKVLIFLALYLLPLKINTKYIIKYFTTASFKFYN